MEKMSNQPCLGTKKLIENLKLICENNEYDFNVLMPAIIQANIGWFSRSMATALFAFCKDEDGDWCILASERGKLEHDTSSCGFT